MVSILYAPQKVFEFFRFKVFDVKPSHRDRPGRLPFSSNMQNNSLIVELSFQNQRSSSSRNLFLSPYGKTNASLLTYVILHQNRKKPRLGDKTKRGNKKKFFVKKIMKWRRRQESQKIGCEREKGSWKLAPHPGLWMLLFSTTPKTTYSETKIVFSTDLNSMMLTKSYSSTRVCSKHFRTSYCNTY